MKLSPSLSFVFPLKAACRRIQSVSHLLSSSGWIGPASCLILAEGWRHRPFCVYKGLYEKRCLVFFIFFTVQFWLYVVGPLRLLGWTFTWMDVYLDVGDILIEWARDKLAGVGLAVDRSIVLPRPSLSFNKSWTGSNLWRESKMRTREQDKNQNTFFLLFCWPAFVYPYVLC